ncbi:hypothetical protein Tco_1099065 [Tanacetum coccineum]
MMGAPECMWISEFMHGVNNPELTKRLNEHVPKTMEEMMTVTTAFIRGEAAAASKKKGKDGGLISLPPSPERPNKSSQLKQKFKPPPPMLKKQIKELVRAGKLSHLIKEIKQGRDQTKNGKKEAPTKDKSLAIYMIQPWQRMTRQKLTQSFARGSEITFLPLANSDGTEGPLVIEAEISGHMIHHMYIDGGSSTEILYEHCFNQLWPEIKNQLVLATTLLTGFSGESIWPLGQLRLLFPSNGGIVTICSTILIPTECTTMITSSKEVHKEAKVRPKNFKIALHLNFPDQEVAIGGTLSIEGRMKLCSLLKKNLDIFAWQPSDMTGVP